MTYAEAVNNYNACNDEYEQAVANGRPLKEILRLSGRRIASLQVVEKISRKESRSDYGVVEAKLRDALVKHKKHLSDMDIKNREGESYSIITELSVGAKSLVNAVKMRKYAYTQEQEKTANKDILSGVGKNLKNIVKAPIALTTKILKTSLTATILLAPVSLGLGILHAAWECMDSKKSPYEGKTVAKMSSGLTKVMGRLHGKVQRI